MRDIKVTTAGFFASGVLFRTYIRGCDTRNSDGTLSPDLLFINNNFSVLQLKDKLNGTRLLKFECLGSGNFFSTLAPLRQRSVCGRFLAVGNEPSDWS